MSDERATVDVITNWDWWCRKCERWTPCGKAHHCPGTGAVEPEPTDSMYAAYRKQKPDTERIARLEARVKQLEAQIAALTGDLK